MGSYCNHRLIKPIPPSSSSLIPAAILVLMGPLPASKPSMETVALNVPVTVERKQNQNLEEQIPKPYLARALAAADANHPNGTAWRDHKNMSVLQQHAAFFDRNNDGIIYPWETYLGFRALGFSILISLFGIFFINFGLSYRSQPGWIPSPFFSVHIKNIHKCKHGSDTGTYDTEGRFDPSKFDAIFSKFALTHPDALTLEEISTMLQVNRYLNDFFGWIASFLEWHLLYLIGKDEKGLLHREIVRGAFDGSLFEQLEIKKRDSHKKAA